MRFKKTTRSKKKAIVVHREADKLVFDNATAFAKELGVAPGSVASAALRGHLCKGWRVQYV